MGLQSQLAIGLLHVLIVANSGGAQNVTTCNAPNLPGTQHNVTCNVSYTSVAELSCPARAGVNAFWKRQTVKGSEPLCRAQGRNCYLSDLRNEDTGLYFCFDPVINGSYTYYVHLIVLAPPSLEGVAYCHETHLCVTSRVVADVTEDFTITVQYQGVEPIHVDWKHNNDTLTCEKPHCVEKHSHGETSITIFAPHERTPNDSGLYYANVSNSYGWNVSSTEAVVQCYPPYPPIAHSQNSSKTFTANNKASLSCEISISDDAYLTICYASSSETYKDIINKTTAESCTKCPPRSEGPCPSIPRKPHWKITRHPVNGYCQFPIDTFIHIDHISKEDEGTLYCVWGDDYDHFHEVYTATRITVKEPLVVILSVSIPAGVIVLVVVVYSLVIRMRQVKRANGRIAPANGDAEVTHPRLTDYEGGSDSEPESIATNAAKRKPKLRKKKTSKIDQNVATPQTPLLGGPSRPGYGSYATETETDTHSRTDHRTSGSFAHDSEFPEPVQTDMLSSLSDSEPI